MNQNEKTPMPLSRLLPAAAILLTAVVAWTRLMTSPEPTLATHANTHAFDLNDFIAVIAALATLAYVIYSHLAEQRARIRLEQHVLERTRELVEVNRQLEAHIQQRKLSEKTAKLAQEHAQAASQAKGQFLANMSHEIRTPMNAILGMAELVGDTPLTQEQREYIDAIKSAADALLDIINDILDFSKIEARKLELKPINFSLRECLDNTLTVMAIRAAAKNLELTCHIAADIPDDLIGDPGRLRQVLINLINNAIKFTHDGEVAVAIVLKQRAEKNITLHVSVRDTGIGIAADQQKKIFHAFEQADGSTTRRYGGTGLGLAISTELVKLMNGDIWVESSLGRGTTLHFTAELGLQDVDHPASRIRLLDDLRNMPVLVVDDNATNRTILNEMLQSWTLVPTLVDGGDKAIEELQRHRDDAGFPLIILDVCMPDIDGFRVVEKLRSDPSLRGAPIMMLSSIDRQQDIQRCRELGVARYVTKPVRQSDLLNAIMETLNLRTGHTTPTLRTSTLDTVGRPLNILLAEDNIINQKLATRMLEKHNHRVTLANNGREAVRMAETGSFDVILMDVQMPEMGGFEATQIIRIREKKLNRHTPIVALTAHAMAGDRERCLHAGMDDYVAKPIQPEQLFRTLRSLCNSEELAAASA